MRLFIHIPKNGGMTVRKGLGSRDDVLIGTHHHHISPEYTTAVIKTMNEYGEHHGKEHARWRDWRVDLREKYSAFAIVRNPWSRTVSRYTFMMNAIKKRKGSYRLYQACTFPDFLEQRHEWANVPYFWHRPIRGWYQQKDYVTDEDGNLRCDCLRFATDDLKEYFQLSQAPFPRNISNGAVRKGHTVTPHEHYSKFYGGRERKIIEEWYGEDIEFFGFTFHGNATKNIWMPTS
jgi:hypothetical protein